MTTYNVRVSRSDAAEGPFTDYFGKAVKDTTNNFPILTAPYRLRTIPDGRVQRIVPSFLTVKETILWHIRDVCHRKIS